jgi:hypothetical protein
MISSQPGFTVFQYLDEEGQFDYKKYVSAQVAANKRKINCVWAQESNIEFLSVRLKRRLKQLRFGICHGTRRGVEQQWFKKYLGCDVIGTEISETATDFPDTIQHDFHEVKPEWVNAVDFIYSNSLDHSYDPEKCLNAWVSCLTDDGVLIVEHSEGVDERSKESDPFGAHLHMMPYLILNWGAGRYSAREMIRAPSKSMFMDREFETFFIFIQKNKEGPLSA